VPITEILSAIEGILQIEERKKRYRTSVNYPGVSVVLPILNEERYLAHAIEAILEQQYPGDFEVILALGPSRDRTNEIAEKLRAQDSRVVLVESPTGRTAAGLNLAIKKSRFDIICRIDGHAEVSKTYIRDAVEIMEETNAVNVGGIMAAVGKTSFEGAVATAMRSPLGVGGARFHVGGSAGPADTVYLGVFKKSSLLAVGLYDERFTRAQDWELNYRLRKSGGIIWFDPRLVVTYRPRPTLKALAKQYFEYGRWRHAVVRTHKGTANYRYLAPPAATLVIAISLIAGIFLHPLLFIPALTYAAAIFAGALVIGKSIKEKVTLPAVLATMHISWGIGYLTSPRKLIS
jgi:glycosyltransferase involved in cell wall biosynthesis